MNSPRAIATVTVFAAAIAACDGPSVVRDSGTDAAADVATCVVARPSFDSDLPTAIPYRIVTVRGHAPGGSVALIGGLDPGGPVRVMVGLEDAFCLDYKILDPSGAQDFNLTLQSQDPDGLLSCMTSSATLRYDPAAPAVAGARTCAGSDPAECTTDHESGDLCTNGRDDDCDGLKDMQERECSACQDDPFEPNQPPPGGNPAADVPRVAPNGTFNNLVICPGDADYYGLTVFENTTIAARINYPNTGSDLRLELLNERAQVIATGSLTMGTAGRVRTVTGTYRSPDAGVPSDGGGGTVSNPYFRVRVTGATTTATNEYSLTVNTQRN